MKDICILHNIIQMHNNVLWDWQYYVIYSHKTLTDLNKVWQNDELNNTQNWSQVV
jgi:hypothetical protein